MIKCLICNQEFEKRVSFCNHIVRKHKLNSKEYYDKYLKHPEDGICKYDSCNKPTHFLNVEEGYKECCCLEHTNLYRYGVKSNLNFAEVKEKAQKNSHTPEAIEKQAQTNLKRYGTRAPLQNKKIMDKAKQTCLEKYGVENPYQAEEVKAKCAKTKEERYGDANYNNRDKAKQTCLEKYGVSSAMRVDDVKEKIKQTCQKRYGFDSYSSTAECKERLKQTCMQKYGVSSIAHVNEVREKAKQTCIERYGVDNVFKSKKHIRKRMQTRLDRKAKFEIENNCTSIANIIATYGQGWLAIKDEITLFHLGNYTFVLNDDISKIEDYNNTHTRSRQEDEIYDYISSIYAGQIIRNSRSIIKPLELDIYLPDIKLAIEYNGLYWHSTNNGSDKYSHLHKTELCESKGIRLIHISDYYWLNKKDICKSIISSAFNIYENRIDAKLCDIKEISQSDLDIFLNTNHIEGTVTASYRLGLYYEDELVQVIAINNNELLRICTKLNTKIVGGFSKLIKNQPYNLIAYVDRSLFNGTDYISVGFSVIDITEPLYSYYKYNQKINDTKIKAQHMIQNGWLQVYDCGSFKMQYLKEDSVENL